MTPRRTRMPGAVPSEVGIPAGVSTPEGDGGPNRYGDRTDFPSRSGKDR